MILLKEAAEVLAVVVPVAIINVSGQMDHSLKQNRNDIR